MPVDWFPIVGFTGVVNLLQGEANPSGKLVDTYAKNFPVSSGYHLCTDENTPEWANLDEVLEYCSDSDQYVSNYLIYAENIYVGYKYYETCYEDTVLGNGNADSIVGSSTGKAWNYNDEIAYPFGYGLSYTTFSQTLDGVEYDETTDTYNVKVTVTNTGDTAGKSVAEVYDRPHMGIMKKRTMWRNLQSRLWALIRQISWRQVLETLEIPVERYLCKLRLHQCQRAILSEGDYYFAIGDDAPRCPEQYSCCKRCQGNDRCIGREG